MKPKVWAAAALAAALATGCATAGKVSVLQAPSAALARGSTYAWAPISGVALGAPAPEIVNEITAERLATATDSVLSSKGYRRTQDPREADFIVFYRVITTPRLDANLTAHGGACAPFCDRPSDYSLSTSQKTEGKLVLNLLERRTGRLVYQATSVKEISSEDASPERLNSTLEQMTKALPSGEPPV
jgi:hypothetical protein